MKKLLYFLVFVLLSCSVFSMNLTSNLISYYPFDGDATSTTNMYNGTISAGVYNATGKINGGFNHSTGSSNINFGSQLNNARTINMWVKFPSICVSGSNAICGIIGNLHANTDVGYELLRFDTTGKFAGFTYNFGSSGITSTGAIPLNTWVMISYVMYDNNYSIFYNGIYNNSGVFSYSNYTPSSYNLQTNRPTSTPEQLGDIGVYDELGLWSVPLNASDIYTLYNLGAGLSYPFVSVTVNFTSNTTQTGIYAQDWIYFQITNITSPTNTNVTLWKNNVLIFSSYSPTPLLPIQSNITGLTDGTYILNATNTSQSYEIILDNVNPMITTNFNNNSTYLKNNVTGQFNFTDDNLYSWNVSIDGVTFANASNVNYTFYSYNLSYNISNKSVGLHNGQIIVKDGHTANSIGNIDIINKGGMLFDAELVFKTDKFNEISIVAVGSKLGDSFSTEKKTDRYSFDYVTSEVKESYSFIVDVKQRGYIVDKPSSPYGRWIVSGDNWLDFASETMDNSRTEIMQNDKEGYQFLITTYPKKELVKEIGEDVIITFNSVGELNIITYNFTFYVVNAYMNYENALSNTSTINTLIINYTGTPFTSVDFMKSFIYNNSNTSFSSIDYSGYSIYTSNFNVPKVNNNTNVSFFWNITLTGGENYILNGSHTVFVVNIINCSLGGTNIFNVTIFNENNFNDKLLSNFEYVVTAYFNGNKIVPIIINSSQFNSNSFSVCFSSLDFNFSYDLYALYNAIGGFTERIYFYNLSSSPTTIINAGNYNDTTSTSVANLLIKDTNYLSYPNVIVNLQRFYTSENLWRTVQWDKSDDYGTTIFNIREKDTNYRILIYDINNNLLKQTDTLKFFCGGSYCDIVQIINPSDLVLTNNLTFSNSYNNVSQVLTTTWYDNSNKTSSLRIYVTQETFKGSVIICNNTGYGSSGLMMCNTNGYNGTIAVRVYSTASPERAVYLYYFDKLSLTLASVIGAKEGSFWAGMFLVCIASFGVVVSPVVGMALSIFGLIVLSMLGLVTFISTTLIILVIIIALVLAIKVKT